MNQEQSQPLPVEKFDIKLKSNSKDGLILQLHHTERNSRGETRRIRFSTGTFDDSQEKLACADNIGNLFILDFGDLKFWKLTEIGPCTALHFVPLKIDQLVTANTNKHVNIIDIETGRILLSMSGHTAHVKHISFSNSKLNNFLTASPEEAILWETRNYTKFFTLNTYAGAQIEQIIFSPASEYLVACFRNDTVQIWKSESMKSVKQIIPMNLRHMKSIAFTMNGRVMAMAGKSSTLILFSMDTWKALKSVDLTQYEITSTNQITFIPQLFDGGSNKILAILSSDCVVKLLDLESMTITYKIYPESSGIRKLVVSPTGKYFLSILHQGEVNIYNTSQLMELALRKQNKEMPTTSNYRTHVIREQHPSKAEVEYKMRSCLDSARLRRILMQYGEYPDKFRPIIWRSLLNTPRNKIAYAALVDKGIHTAYKNIEKQFTIHSIVTLKSLKTLLSCLAHWCPLFGITKFLPAFVFPFVKVLKKDPLLLFESVASILMNHCQLWFEYAPLPPISMLAMIENILGEHDQQLLDHFCEAGVTSQTYALHILETAFSEVLTCSEWLILWDHILSNEPSFILMAVVSYNIVQRNAIQRLKTYEQLEHFFHMQNPICKKAFLKKAYVLLNETSDEIHPRKLFDGFKSLQEGDCYQQFTGYPKATICLKIAKTKQKATVKKRTLQSLTKSSQEKIIKEMSQSSVTEGKTVDSDDSVDNIKNREKNTVNIKQHRCRSGDHTSVKHHGDFSRKHIKEKFICPVKLTQEHQDSTCNNKEKENHKKSSRSLPTESKSKVKTPDKYNVDLEKEIERLLQSCSDTDT